MQSLTLSPTYSIDTTVKFSAQDFEEAKTTNWEGVRSHQAKCILRVEFPPPPARFSYELTGLQVDRIKSSWTRSVSSTRVIPKYQESQVKSARISRLSPPSLTILSTAYLKLYHTVLKKGFPILTLGILCILTTIPNRPPILQLGSWSNWRSSVIYPISFLSNYYNI